MDAAAFDNEFCRMSAFYYVDVYNALSASADPIGHLTS